MGSLKAVLFSENESFNRNYSPIRKAVDLLNEKAHHATALFRASPADNSVVEDHRTMARAVKSDLQKVLNLIVDSAEKRLSHLPPKEAAAVRKKIRRIASATASRGRKNVS